MNGKGLIGMVEFIIPKTSLELINKILKAYLIVYSEDALKAKDVSAKTGYSVAQIWKSNGFIIKIGLLSKIKGGFILTPIGKEYAALLMNNRDDEAYELLKNIILQYEPIEFIINFVKLEGSVNMEQLRKRIINLAGLNLKIADHGAGLNGIIEILFATKILKFQDEKIILGDI